ncbi:neurogenic locus Notch protein-like isoform X3 [Pomacea canaliculata]|uniref:neurogenic locus Notch protein-like isoform X3 n=1 Tax=Pomacea canaliculata TaxID=400727 RepID=UPI000D72E405|nr:neurogenic locus Notch protein-like isoform X3 [Pomacea canaliculata]
MGAAGCFLLLLTISELGLNTLVVSQITEPTSDQSGSIHSGTFYALGLKEKDEMFLEKYINATLAAANFSGTIDLEYVKQEQCLSFHVLLTSRRDDNSSNLFMLLEGVNIIMDGVSNPVNITTVSLDCKGTSVAVRLFILGRVNKTNEEILQNYLLRKVDYMGEWSVDFSSIGNCTMAFVNGTVLKVLVAVANSTLHSLNGTKVNVTATASYNITNSTNNPMCWDVPSELNECQSGQKFCPYRKKCILQSFFCDGKDDCGDNSDEANCLEYVGQQCSNFSCMNGGSCMFRQGQGQFCMCTSGFSGLTCKDTNKTQEVYAVNITVQYKWQADFIDPMSNMYKNLSNGIIAGVNSTMYGAIHYISSNVLNIRDGGDNSLVVTVAVNFSGVLDAVEISARQQKLQEKGFSIGAKTINVTTIIQARQGPCQIRSCGNGLCVVVMGQRSECRCMPQQSPENCDYMDCGINVCRNGICINDSYYGGYVCNCSQSFSGNSCEVNVCKELGAGVCSGHGKCIGNFLYDIICQCDEGYGGIFCNETGKDNLTDCQRQERLNTFFLKALMGKVTVLPAFLNGKTLQQQLSDIQYTNIEVSSCWSSGSLRYGQYKSVCVYKTANISESPLCYCTNSNGSFISNKYSNGSCKVTEKPGWCPSPQDAGSGTMECFQDVDCYGSRKCCKESTGYRCQEPLFTEVCRRFIANPCGQNGHCVGNIFNGTLCLCQPGYSGIACESPTPDVLTECQRSYQLMNYMVQTLLGKTPAPESINTTLAAMLIGLNISKLQVPTCWPSNDMSSGNYKYICDFNVTSLTTDGCMCTNDLGEQRGIMKMNGDCDSKYLGQQCSNFSCMNGGSCMFRQGQGQYCMCTSGFYGLTCEETNASTKYVGQQCSNFSCMNGGSCMFRQGQGQFCMCTSGFYGLTCEETDTSTTSSNKPGVCPVVPPNTFGITVESCSNDKDCSRAQKCCSNGGGHVCVDPVHYSYFTMRINISSPWLPEYNISESQPRAALMKELRTLVMAYLPEMISMNITNVRPGSIIADVRVTTNVSVSILSISKLELGLNLSSITLNGSTYQVTNATYVPDDQCQTLSCESGCRCINTTAKGLQCLCPSKLSQDPCQQGVCQNGGNCSSHLTTDFTWNYFCSCPAGVYGNNCEESACSLFPIMCGMGRCVGDLDRNLCECPADRKGILCEETGSEKLSSCQRKQRLSQFALQILKGVPVIGITAYQLRQLLLAAKILWLPSYSCQTDGTYGLTANMTSVTSLQTRFACVDEDGIEDNCEAKVCSVMTQYNICQSGSQCVGNIYNQLCDCTTAQKPSHGALCELPGKANETECERRRGLGELVVAVLRSQISLEMISAKFIYEIVHSMLREIHVNTVWQPQCFPNGSYTNAGCQFQVDKPDTKECYCVDENEQRRMDIPSNSESPPQCPLTHICHLPVVKESCSSSMPRFYFDTETKSCKSFSYGECGGNNNNFKTLQECCSTCGINASQAYSYQQLLACNASICKDSTCFNSPCAVYMQDTCTGETYIADRLNKSRRFQPSSCNSILHTSCEIHTCKVMTANENADKKFQKVLPVCTDDGTYSPIQQLDNGTRVCVDAFGEAVQLVPPSGKCKKDQIVEIKIILRYDVDYDKYAAGKESEVEKALVDRMVSFGIPRRMIKNVKVKRGSVIIEADVQNDTDVDIAIVKPLVEQKAESGGLNLEVNNQTFALMSDGLTFNVTTAPQVQEEEKPEEKHGLTTEEIIIIAVICPVAGLALIIIIIIVVVCCCRKQKPAAKADNGCYSKMETNTRGGASVSNNTYDMINMNSAQRLSGGIENKAYEDGYDESSGYVKVRM